MKTVGSLSSQSGFTLVEMMVALVLGLLVVLGASQMYLTTIQTSQAVADLAARQGVVNYFVNVVSNEVRASDEVSPVLDGNPVNSSGNLEIDYTSGDPEFGELYCPPSESLQSLEYYSEYDADLGEFYLVVVPFCEARQDPQRAVTGISGLVFDRGTNDKFVDVTLTLTSSDTTFSSAAAGKNTLKMRLVSHSSSIFH